MKKKSLVVAIISIILLVSLFAVACDKPEEDKLLEYKMIMPDGAPTLAAGELIINPVLDDVKAKINTEIVAPSAIAQTLVKKEAEFAIMPSNMAATVYNKNEDIKVLATVTSGNLYILGNKAEKLTDIKGLLGKKIYSIGNNAVPGIILQSTLKANNISYEMGDVNIENKVVIQFLSDGPSVMQNLMKDKKQGIESYGLIGEPAVSVAINKGLVENFDLQSEYKSAMNSDVYGYAQAVLVARKDICENKDLIESVLKAFEKNDLALQNDSKSVVDAIKNKFEESTLDSTKMTKDVITRCSIKTIRVASNSGIIKTTFNQFEDINKNSIGGKLPAEAFYYVG